MQPDENQIKLGNLDGHEMIKTGRKLSIEGTGLKIRTRRLIFRDHNMAGKPQKIKNEIKIFQNN